MKKKLAIIMSHAIQYQTPLLRKLVASEDIDLMVYLNWDFGVKEGYDPEFNVTVKWDIPVLEGYPYKFLKNFSPKPSSNFFGQLNFGIVRELIRNRYDAVLIYGWNSFVNWLVLIVAPIIGTRILLHGESPLNQELQKSKLKRFFKKLLFGTLLKRVSAFLYIGEQNKKFYEYYGISKEKLFFVPYAVDNERFIKTGEELKPKRRELRKKLLGIEDDCPIILFGGKLIEKKRPMDLLRAYELLITSYKLPLVPTLVFLGDGALRSELEMYASKHNLKDVHFVGFKNQTESPAFYFISDVFVLPSGMGETWGLMVNEAMCFDLPVIVSDVVGCGYDLVKRGENGFVFPLGDIERLAECLFLTLSGNYRKKSLEIIKNYSHEKDIEGIRRALKI